MQPRRRACMGPPGQTGVKARTRARARACTQATRVGGRTRTGMNAQRTTVTQTQFVDTRDAEGDEAESVLRFARGHGHSHTG